MTPLPIVSLHAESDRPEKHKHADNPDIPYEVDTPFDTLLSPCQWSGEPIDDEAGCQDRKVECWIVMMHICHSSHRHEGQVMKEPPNHRVQSTIVNMIDITGLELIVTSLPPNEVPEYQNAKDTQRGGCGPVYEGIS